MEKMAMDGSPALKLIAGVSDISGLQAAGINDVEDYLNASIRAVARLTKQKAEEVKTRQQAAALYYYSGLDAALSLRLAQAGVEVPCQMLFDDEVDFPVRGEWEKRALERARLNTAFDNLRRFLMEQSPANRKELVRSLSKLTPRQKRAAKRSFALLRSMPQFQWLHVGIEKLVAQGVDDQEIEGLIAAISEETMGEVLKRLRNDCEVK